MQGEKIKANTPKKKKKVPKGEDKGVSAAYGLRTLPCNQMETLM